MRTPSGREIHAALVKAVAEKLRAEGYEVLIYPSLGEGCRVDVLAIKGGERIGVECMVRPSWEAIRGRLDACRGQLTRLLLAVPSDVDVSERGRVEGVEVLRVELPKEYRRVKVAVQIPELLWERLKAIAERLRTSDERLVERAIAELVERLEAEGQRRESCSL